jgi:hypothetical protein
MHNNIRISIRRLHARSSPTHATNILRALIEDMSDSNGNVNTANVSTRRKMATVLQKQQRGSFP